MSESKQQATGAITYTGKVSVDLVVGDRIIKTYHYHNSGRSKLFRSLCNFLAGKPATYPRYLVCYAVAAKDASTNGYFDIADNFEDIDKCACSLAVELQEATVVDLAEGPVCRYRTRVGLEQLFTFAPGNDLNINVLALYGDASSGQAHFTDSMAYFLLPEPIQIDGSGAGHYSYLAIQWDLSFENGTTSQENQGGAQ